MAVSLNFLSLEENTSCQHTKLDSYASANQSWKLPYRTPSKSILEPYCWKEPARCRIAQCKYSKLSLLRNLPWRSWDRLWQPSYQLISWQYCRRSTQTLLSEDFRVWEIQFRSVHRLRCIIYPKQLPNFY